MVDDSEQDKKEDKFDAFTPEGEAVGYISLDQARVLAIEHARDNRDFYGRRYSRQDLVWEVVETWEGEDYYDIQLSYRPVRGFAGEPGLEQFTVDKAGPIRLRQILSEPRPARRLRRFVVWGVVIVVAAIGGLIALGVLLRNDGAEPPQVVAEPTARATALTQVIVEPTLRPASPTVTATAEEVFGPEDAGFYELLPDQDRELTSPDGDVTVEIDAGSVDRPVTFRYQTRSVNQMPSLPPGFGAPQRGFDLSVVQEGQPASVRFEFKKPVTITVHLRASTYADLRRRPGAELVIMHYDQKDNFWDPLVTEVDLAAGTARARVDSLSIFALAARAPEPSPTATLEECYDVRSRRDKVEILNVEPVPNTPLERGSIVTVTADVRYVLDSHVKAPLVLHYEYQRDASGGVFGQTFSERIDVGIGEGTVTLTGTLEVPDLDSTNVAVIMEPPGDAVQSAGFDCWDQPLAVSKGVGYAILVRSLEPTATVTAIPTMAPTVAPAPTAELPYRLEVSAAPEGAGTVQMFPAAVDNLYSRGTVVVITALCRFGFFAWAGEVPGEVSPTTNPIPVTMDGDRRLVAICAEATPTPTPAPDTGGGPINDGDNVSAAIDTEGDSDDWTFFGVQGELVTVFIRPTLRSDLDPLVELVAPSGIIETFDDDSGGDRNALISEWPLHETGTYIIRAMAYDNATTGEYRANLSISASVDTGGGPISRFETVVADIGTEGDSDDWTFFAVKGVMVTISMSRTLGSGLDPLLELVAPSGFLELSDDDSGGDGNALIGEWALEETGTYTIRATAYDNASTGEYQLSFSVRVPPQSTPTPIADTGGGRINSGDTMIAAIDTIGDSDEWTFFGSRGDVVTISMDHALGSDLDSLVELLAPSGFLEVTDDDSGGDGNALINGWALQETGTYTIRTVAYDHASTGEYSLSLDIRVPPTPTPTPVVFNLAPGVPELWKAPLVISEQRSPFLEVPAAPGGPFIAGQEVFLHWAVVNDSGVPVTTEFLVVIDIDGHPELKFVVDRLDSGEFARELNIPVTIGSAGVHTVALFVDPDNRVHEGNEGDNLFVVTQTWLAPEATPTPTATPAAAKVEYLSGRFQSGALLGTRIEVPVGSGVFMYVTLGASGFATGQLTVEVWKDIALATDQLKRSCSATWSFSAGAVQEVLACDFIADQLTTGAFQHYYYKVFWNGDLIYAPDRANREYVITFEALTPTPTATSIPKPSPSPTAAPASVTGISSSSGSVALGAPPPSVAPGALESSTKIVAFSERLSYKLPSALPVNISSPGTYDQLTDLTPASLPAGTVVNSYLIHLDPVAKNTVQLTGSVTFAADIVGVITTDEDMNDTDKSLGYPGTTYQAGPARGLDMPNQTSLSSPSTSGQSR